MRLFKHKQPEGSPCPRCSQLVSEADGLTCPLCGWDLREAYQGPVTGDATPPAHAGSARDTSATVGSGNGAASERRDPLREP